MKQLKNRIEPARDLLDIYVSLIHKWQKAVNLVSNKELDNLWDRHIVDSAQLYYMIPDNSKILVDMGSGGGFPGIVIAILNKVMNGSLSDIYLIESDNKKTIFLQEVSRILNLNIKIINERLEKVENIKADVITSRALGDVSHLIEWGRNFYKTDTLFLLLKGENVDSELKMVSRDFKCKKIPSIVDAKGCILNIKEVNY